MTTTPRLLACQEIASAVAYVDPALTADLILDIAVKDAIAKIRHDRQTPAYRLARAELVLARAGASADRLLGGTR